MHTKETHFYLRDILHKLILTNSYVSKYPNILPLGSYDVIIGIDWLEVHRVKLDYYSKDFECLDEE